jgi:hypothetical protein
MSEHINGIQYATADVFKHLNNLSIKLVPFILPDCGAVGAR